MAGEKATVSYAIEPRLSREEFLDVLHRSTLDQRRPVDDENTIDSMLANADVIVTARHAGLLVGIARSITDFAYCTYLSDLAVDTRYQKQGIGKALVKRTHQEAGLKTTLILLSAPAAESYYPHIGMQSHRSCWVLPPPRES